MRAAVGRGSADTGLLGGTRIPLLGAEEEGKCGFRLDMEAMLFFFAACKMRDAVGVRGFMRLE